MCERSSRSAGVSPLTTVVTATGSELPWLPLSCLTAAISPATATSSVATVVTVPVVVLRKDEKRDIRDLVLGTRV